eukprot:2765488-Pleurochrysis_carterae.AAC.1
MAALKAAQASLATTHRDARARTRLDGDDTRACWADAVNDRTYMTLIGTLRDVKGMRTLLHAMAARRTLRFLILIGGHSPLAKQPYLNFSRLLRQGEDRSFHPCDGRGVKLRPRMARRAIMGGLPCRRRRRDMTSLSGNAMFGKAGL